MSFLLVQKTIVVFNEHLCLDTLWMLPVNQQRRGPGAFNEWETQTLFQAWVTWLAVHSSGAGLRGKGSGPTRCWKNDASLTFMRQNRGPWQMSPMSPWPILNRGAWQARGSVSREPRTAPSSWQMCLETRTGSSYRLFRQLWAMWVTLSPRISKQKLSPTCSNLTFGFIRDPSAAANSSCFLRKI